MKESDKVCVNCVNLKLVEKQCPVSQEQSFCDVIQNLIFSTRFLILKKDKLIKFGCNSFKKK